VITRQLHLSFPVRPDCHNDGRHHTGFGW
jgi:hypothetical protein